MKTRYLLAMLPFMGCATSGSLNSRGLNSDKIEDILNQVKQNGAKTEFVDFVTSRSESDSSSALSATRLKRNPLYPTMSMSIKILSYPSQVDSTEGITWEAGYKGSHRGHRMVLTEGGCLSSRTLETTFRRPDGENVTVRESDTIFKGKQVSRIDGIPEHVIIEENFMAPTRTKVGKKAIYSRYTETTKTFEDLQTTTRDSVGKEYRQVLERYITKP